MFWDFDSLHQKPRVGGTHGCVHCDGSDGWRSPVPRGENTGGCDRLPHPPTIALLPPTGSERCDALWTVCEMAGAVLPDGFDVAASLVLTVEAAAFRIGLDVSASLKPAVAAEATGKRKTLRRP